MSAELWTVDMARSEITFTLRHLVLASIKGRFEAWRALVSIDPAEPERSCVEAEIEAASIDTGAVERDDHIRSAEFLNVQAFPLIRYRSRAVARAGRDRYTVIGDLTIKDRTGQVTLELEDLGPAADSSSVARTGFHALGTIDRQHFGLRWNQDLDTGGVVLGDKISIDVAVEVVRDGHALAAKGETAGIPAAVDRTG
jgi:polyisoprenoid-binding protein YceI